jgi:NAD(P)-dependent dehydrogenase (short-subunit alcohol dehydrogenase family)
MANRAGKTYIITGGVSGLGLATAQLLYSQGANVSLFDRNDDLANDVIPANFTDASRVLFCKVDITDEGNVKSAVADTVARFGSLHGVVNSAGIGSAMTTVNGKGKTHSSKVFDYVVKINLMGSFYCAAHGAAAMREAGHKDGACEIWEWKGWGGLGWGGVAWRVGWRPLT